MNELYIADNRSVLDLLVKQGRKYDIVYLDPPYNGLLPKGEVPENIRSDDEWEQDISQVLSLVYRLLDKPGIVIISINDREAARVGCVCERIFEKRNFMAQIVRKRVKEFPQSAHVFARMHEYLLVYAVDAALVHENYTGKPVSTWWDDAGTDEDALEDIRKLFGSIIFDYPKPVKFLKRCFQIFDKSNLRVLDPFAGSGTTGQAILEMNVEDGGTRSFTLIQRSEIYNERDIAEVCRQRINKVNALTGAAEKIAVYKTENDDD